MPDRTDTPYVGPRAFVPGEILYGRDPDARALLDLLIANRIVVLYSPSGAGKTSLLQAKLVPTLEDEENLSVLPIMRVTHPKAFLEDPRKYNRYLFSALLHLDLDSNDGLGVPDEDLAQWTMSAYMKRRVPESENTVMIFDQFEEILTRDPTDTDDKREFFEQVGETLRNHHLWAVFSLREEYLGGFKPYHDAIPTRFRNTFRLNFLEKGAALEAIQRPARDFGVDFVDAAAQALVDDLRLVQVSRPDGAPETKLGPTVEPVQIQVVCRNIWETPRSDHNKITIDDFKAVSVDKALAAYYANAVKSVADAHKVEERFVREWVDENLISERGIRLPVLQEPNTSRGLDNDVISALINEYVVREETRHGATWYELTHDRMIEPIQTNNIAWKESKLAPFQRQAQAWQRSDRPDQLLLRGGALKSANAVKSNYTLTKTEEKFLISSDVQQKKRRLHSALVFGSPGVVLFVSGFLWYSSEQDKFETEQETKVKYEFILQQEALHQTAGMLMLSSEDDVSTVGFDSTSGRLVTGGKTGQVRVWDVTDRARPNFSMTSEVPVDYQWTLSGDVYELAFAPRSNRVIAVVRDKDRNSAVKLFSDITNRDVEPRNLVSLEGDVLSLSFSPDGRWLATATNTGSVVHLHDTSDPTTEPSLVEETAVVETLAFSPDGRWLATATGTGSVVHLRDMSDLTGKATVVQEKGIVRSLAFSPDGRWLATATDAEDFFNLHDMSDPTVKPAVVHRKGVITSLAFSPDGCFLATAIQDIPSNDSSISLYKMGYRSDSSSGKCVSSGTVPSSDPIFSQRVATTRITTTVFSPDGRWLAAMIPGEHRVKLWKTNDMNLESGPNLSGSGEIEGLAFSFDGKMLAIAQGGVRLFVLK